MVALALSFSSGNYNSTTADSNGFWLTYSECELVSQSVANNTSTIRFTVVLRHSSSNTFSQWNIQRWARIRYFLNGSSTQTLAYFFDTTNQISMPTTSLTIGSGTVTIPHDENGTRTVTFSAFADAVVNSTSPIKTPINTTVTGSVTLPAIPRTPPPTSPTYLYASSNSSTGIDLYWGGATGEGITYGIYYSSSASATPSSGTSPIFTTTNTYYTDTSVSRDTYRYYWVRAQNSSGNSAWYPSGNGISGISPTLRTVNFNNTYGSNGSSSVDVLNGNTTTFPNPGTRSGYSFVGWNNNSQYVPGASTPAVFSNTTYSADNGWEVLAPGFTDQSVTGQLYINQTIQSTANNTVSATNTATYQIQYWGSGLNPTDWLSINNSGVLSGSTNKVGSYTFRIAATSSNNVTTYSNTITINVVYPGKRTNSLLSPTPLVTAKRYDQNSQQWVPLTLMKRFVGIGQPGADANGWKHISD